MESSIPFNIKTDEQIFSDLELILKKEPEFYLALKESIRHIAVTYQDKYEATKNTIDTKQQMYDVERGEISCTYQMSRYLQRFFAPITFAKGGNKNDLFKIMHYALFAVVRKNKVGEKKNKDIVDK